MPAATSIAGELTRVSMVEMLCCRRCNAVIKDKNNNNNKNNNQASLQPKIPPKSSNNCFLGRYTFSQLHCVTENRLSGRFANVQM